MGAVRRDYEIELAFALRIVKEAGYSLLDATAPELTIKDAQQTLDFEMSHEPAVSLGAKWMCHVDEHIVSVALVDDKLGPVVGAVSRPETDELLGGALDTGAFHQVGDDAPTPCSGTLGVASVSCNVVHVPHDRCAELELALDALFERMPVDVTRKACCCCCEGLFEVMSGRADVHVSPPEHCSIGQRRTPVPVLCAFEVLLSEAGGQMTDALGEPIDWAACLASGEHRSGILASEAASHNYLARALTKPFKVKPLTLPRLAEVEGKGNFRIEPVGGGRHLVLQDPEGWSPAALEDFAP